MRPFFPFSLDFFHFSKGGVEPESTKEVQSAPTRTSKNRPTCNSGNWTEMQTRPSCSSASHSTQAEYKTGDAAGVESPCEECSCTNVIGHIPPSESTACAVSESKNLWGAAQILGGGWSGSVEVVVKTTEPFLGHKWRRNPRLCLAADVRFRASIFPFFPWIFIHFPNGGVEPESTKEVQSAPTRTCKKPTPKDFPKK